MQGRGWGPRRPPAGLGQVGPLGGPPWRVGAAVAAAWAIPAWGSPIQACGHPEGARFRRLCVQERNHRTVTRADVATAVTRTEVFDFLVDVVPREGPEPAGVSAAAMAAGFRVVCLCGVAGLAGVAGVLAW